MRQRPLLVSAVCLLVVLLYFFGDKLPAPCGDLLLPGFLPTMWINGSLHDHVMRGYALLGITLNCLFYSAAVLLLAGGIRKLRRVH